MKRPYVVQRPALPIWVTDPSVSVGGRHGREVVEETGYSVTRVAALLLSTSQLWLRAISGQVSSSRSEASCPTCWGKREIRWRTAHNMVMVSRCPECRGTTASGEEIADGLATYVRSLAQPEQLMVAMADLANAWEEVSPGTRTAIGRFVEAGPLHFGARSVEFQTRGHLRAVSILTKAMNGRRKGDDV